MNDINNIKHLNYLANMLEKYPEGVSLICKKEYYFKGAFTNCLAGDFLYMDGISYGEDGNGYYIMKLVKNIHKNIIVKPGDMEEHFELVSNRRKRIIKEYV